MGQIEKKTETQLISHEKMTQINTNNFQNLPHHRRWLSDRGGISQAGDLVYARKSKR